MNKALAQTGTLFLTLSSIVTLAFLFGTKSSRVESTGIAGPSLSGATNWLNSDPLDLRSLRGKVVLIDFWTFTCINWRRTLPYTREWALKYKDQGLVIIGVHTPEFKFEYQPDNVSRSIKEMNIPYPVAMDNNYAIWNSFQNNYWPALYLIDAKGKLRYHKFGEGEYVEAEKQIQKMLKEVSNNISTEAVDVHPEGYEAAPDWKQLQSPENFLGYGRTDGFASPEGIISDQQILYSFPTRLRLNRWALSGQWTMGTEHVRLHSSNGKINYRFRARDLHLIMGPVSPGKMVKFRVTIDGTPPGDAHGLDIDSNGYGTVKEQGMYQLIRQPGQITEREFQIEFLEADVEVYDFTFG